MKFLIASLLAVLVSSQEENGSSDQSLRRRTAAQPQEPQRYIVTYKEDKALMFQNMMYSMQSTGTQAPELVSSMDDLNKVVMVMTADQLMMVEGNPEVYSVEADQLRFATYIDPVLHKEQWDDLVKNHPEVLERDDDPNQSHRNLADTRPYGIDMVNAPEVWAEGYEGSEVTVCVVDTGIDATHEDFRTDELNGFLEGDSSLKWDRDRVGHGTHCSGTIGAVSNNRGVIGVAPRSTIYTVKVFDDNGVWASVLMQAVQKCVDAGARVVSMSLGGSGSSQSEQNYFNNLFSKGEVLVIAAAGNNGNTQMSYPASYESVMSVAAVDSNRNLASFSQRNSMVDIAAPGVNVQSTLPSQRPCSMCGWFFNYNNPYGRSSGTSMATPHVSGVAALLMSANPDATNLEIQTALLDGATDEGRAGYDTSFGYGIVDAKKSLDLLIGNGGGGGVGGGGGDGGSGGGDGGNDGGDGECLAVDFLMVTNVWAAWQTSFYLVDEQGNKIWDYPSVPGSDVVEESGCFDRSGCYTLQLFDTGRNGVQCLFGYCYFRLTIDGVIVTEESNFGEERVIPIGDGCA